MTKWHNPLDMYAAIDDDDAMLNLYFRRSRMSPDEFRELVTHFTSGTPAAEVARLLGRQRKTVNTIFNKIRGRIAEALERESPFTLVDEQGRRRGCYNGVEFVRGARAVAALDPMVVGVFEYAIIIPQLDNLYQLPHVFAEVLPDMSPETLKALKPSPLKACHEDEYQLTQVFTYDDLFRGLGDKGIGVDEHTNTLHKFFNRRLAPSHAVAPVYAIAPQTRYLHLKENEWRFNNRSTRRRYLPLLELLADNPL